MQLSLRTPKIRADFLRALAETGFVSHAAAAVGISLSSVNQYRRRHADFAAACDAARAGPDAKPAYARWTPEMEAVFLTALGHTGSVAGAARRAGTTVSNAFRRRNSIPAFAARWSQAKHDAADRVEDVLFEAALNGFKTVTERCGVVVTRTAQRADAMFKLLERRRPVTGSRMVDVGPQALLEARNKFERYIVHAVELDRARRAAEGVPELPGPPWHGLDPVISTLPPPRC